MINLVLKIKQLSGKVYLVLHDVLYEPKRVWQLQEQTFSFENEKLKSSPTTVFRNGILFKNQYSVM